MTLAGFTDIYWQTAYSVRPVVCGYSDISRIYLNNLSVLFWVFQSEKNRVYSLNVSGNNLNSTRLTQSAQLFS